MAKLDYSEAVSDYNDSEFCIEQLINFWNIPVFKSGKEGFLKKMKEAGFNCEQIIKLDETAYRRSNWYKVTFFNRMIATPELFEDKF